MDDKQKYTKGIVNKMQLSIKHLFGAFLAFLLFSLTSIAYFHEPNSIKAYGFLVLGIIICYVAYTIARKPQYSAFVKFIVYLLILYSFIAALKGIYQHYALHIDRPRALFLHPNVFATHMEIAIPVVLSFLLNRRNSFMKKCLFGIVLLILFGGLIVTLSRGAWIVVVIVLVLMFWKERNTKLITYISLLALGAAAFRYETVLARLNSVVDPQMQSNVERINVFISSLTIIQTYPLTGVGFGNFGKIYPSFMVPGAKELLPHAHNLILAYATEAGILAGLAFLLFLCLVAYYVCVNYKRVSDSDHKYLILGLACGLLAVVLHGFVDYTLRRTTILLVFMLQMGLCLGLVTQYVKQIDKKLPD